MLGSLSKGASIAEGLAVLCRELSCSSAALVPLEPLTWEVLGRGALIEMLPASHNLKAQDRGKEEHHLQNILEMREIAMVQIRGHRSKDRMQKHHGGNKWSGLARSQG